MRFTRRKPVDRLPRRTTATTTHGVSRGSLSFPRQLAQVIFKSRRLFVFDGIEARRRSDRSIIGNSLTPSANLQSNSFHRSRNNDRPLLSRGICDLSRKWTRSSDTNLIPTKYASSVIRGIRRNIKVQAGCYCVISRLHKSTE